MRITALVSARRNSKYLARFLFSYCARTADHANTELRVIMSDHDTWNAELVQHFRGWPGITFDTEDLGLGREGLHEYFNTLLKNVHPLPEWTVYFCEDHHIIADGWDDKIREGIGAKSPEGVWVLVPRWDNTGAVNHVLSRGYLETLGSIARHGSLDSYINDVITMIDRDRIKVLPVLFHDFTADQDPPVMSPEHMSPVRHSDPPQVYESDREMPVLVAEDAGSLQAAIANGR